MTVYPLAVYTADHGMEWLPYPMKDISLEELDRCRKVFGRLPEFDYGERGFEGVFIDAERVFAVRCQSDPGRDFRGRRAIYIAVTWVPRGPEAARTDFEALLDAPAMREPMKKIPSSFTAFAAAGIGGAPFKELPPSLPDGFRRAGQLAAVLETDACLVLKRAIGETDVSVRAIRADAPTLSVANAVSEGGGQLAEGGVAPDLPDAEGGAALDLPEAEGGAALNLPDADVSSPVPPSPRAPVLPWAVGAFGVAILAANLVGGIFVYLKFKRIERENRTLRQSVETLESENAYQGVKDAEMERSVQALTAASEMSQRDFKDDAWKTRNRADELDTKIAAIRNRLDSMEDRLNAIGALEKRMQYNDSSIAWLNSSVNSLNYEIKNLGQEIKKLRSDIGQTVSYGIDNLRSQFDQELLELRSRITVQDMAR